MYGFMVQLGYDFTGECDSGKSENSAIKMYYSFELKSELLYKCSVRFSLSGSNVQSCTQGEEITQRGFLIILNNLEFLEYTN